MKNQLIKKYAVQGEVISLTLSENVFAPSNHGIFFAENIQIESDEKVADIGTGSGLFAILAAKKRAQVYATDISDEAIKITKQNALLNNVTIECRSGTNFAGTNKKFDVILANLPQKLVLTTGTEDIGADGGLNGNSILLNFLNEARLHINKTGRIYIFIYTLTDYLSTLDFVIQFFNARIVAHKSFPEGWIKHDLLRYQELNNSGKIHIYQKGGQWVAEEFLLELTLK